MCIRDSYKPNTIQRRIERRMQIHEITTFDDYARFVGRNAPELDLLYRELLIGVTGFFRDPTTWDHLAENIIPAILERRRVSRSLRIWVPACSTGEEAYTLAMLLIEGMERAHPRWTGAIQIFATDLDPDAIERARRGLYPAGIAADLTPERLNRFLEPEDGFYRVNKQVRSLVVFATQNLISDPPFTKMDIISCRNLMIYLGAELQGAIIPLFHYALNPGGALILGNAESIGGHRELFEAASSRDRIYVRIGGDERRGTRDWQPGTLGTMTTRRPDEPDPVEPAGNLRALADRILLQRYSPAAVITNGTGDIIYVNGRTGDYLEPAAGKANWNIHAMARDGLRSPLTAAFRKAVAARAAVRLPGIEVLAAGRPLVIDVTVDPVSEPGPLAGSVLILFSPVAPGPRRRRAPGPVDPKAVGAIEDELARTRDELETTREEMQASLEELKSTNEELQSTNEELQSTNEELTTSREELQSMNEELQVVNAELNARLEDLVLANSDMENLINSSEIATVFLDGGLRIRRFTSSAVTLISLIPTDVGRPLSDVTMDLEYPNLLEDAAQVLRLSLIHI